MEILQITEKEAKQLYPDASGSFKQMLETKFGKEFLKNVSILPESFEHAISMKGVGAEDILSFPNPKNRKEFYHNAIDKLIFLADCINNKFKADFNNTNQKKWRPWFEWNESKSAFVFSDTYYRYDSTTTNVGVRLHFENTEHAEYFGKQFIDLHNEVLTY